MKKLFKTHAKLCIAVLALALVTVGGTLALMAVSSNSVMNNFAAASIDTEIKEVLTDGNKQVSIVNKTNSSDAYVRARIMVSGINPDQVLIKSTVAEAEAEAEKDTGKDSVYLVMGQDYDATSWNWEKDSSEESYSDDYYYYLDVLEAGEESTKLLEKVVLGKALQGDEGFLENFTVTIYHESVLAIEQPPEITVGVVKSAFDAAAPAATPAPTPGS
ncbi:hypothetical protein [Fournierella sp.]|uniref:hypothetical protein n=1 Tax=Allofournierella sp. TaxID=1940256 RepID=UPI0025BCE3A2|nr:hypothetical protein [Fournierella sp.]